MGDGGGWGGGWGLWVAWGMGYPWGLGDGVPMGHGASGLGPGASGPGVASGRRARTRGGAAVSKEEAPSLYSVAAAGAARPL